MRVLNLLNCHQDFQGKKIIYSNLSCDLISKMLILFWEYLQIVNLGRSHFFPPFFLEGLILQIPFKKRRIPTQPKMGPLPPWEALGKSFLGLLQVGQVEMWKIRSYLKQEVHLPRTPETGASSKGNESSSNHQFSGDILVFKRYIQLCKEVNMKKNNSAHHVFFPTSQRFKVGHVVLKM